MSTFPCTLNQFKKTVAEFCKAAETADADGLECGFKCVALHYLGIEPQPAPGSADEVIAASALKFAARRVAERELALISA